MKIQQGWVLLVLVSKLGNVFSTDPVVGGIGVVLSGGGILLCEKIFLWLFDVTHFRGDIPFVVYSVLIIPSSFE